MSDRSRGVKRTAKSDFDFTSKRITREIVLLGTCFEPRVCFNYSEEYRSRLKSPTSHSNVSPRHPIHFSFEILFLIVFFIFAHLFIEQFTKSKIAKREKKNIDR